MCVTNLLKNYAQGIRTLRRANADAPETALAPKFQKLLEDLIPLLPVRRELVVSPEFNRPGVGRPDIALKKIGAPARAFVELKAPNKSADPERWRNGDKRQFERFRELPCLATCNFAEIRLFGRDRRIDLASVVPDKALCADKSDAAANRLIDAHDAAPLMRLLDRLCAGAGAEPVAKDAEEFAKLMAHSARLVKGIVRDRLAELPKKARNKKDPRRPAIVQVLEEFQEVLYAHPEAAGYSLKDFDELFSGAFAQTLAFGLLLVREGTSKPVAADAWEKMPKEHPLMRTALRVLTMPEVVADVGAGFEVMLDTINSFTPDILKARRSKPDPILFFYEDFLKTFDPGAREKYGVYYTPVEVVRYMTGALDRALRENLGTDGLCDPNVTILDPATGTGTFLLGVAERVWARESKAGRGAGASALQGLFGRMFGLELLVGPYAVAHYRLHHVLSRSQAEGDASDEPLELPRLGVYLADTLAEPGAATAIGPLGFVADGIADERREANRLKTEQPILAILGNPPYRRLEEGENETLVGRWMDGLWDDLKEPVRNAKQGNQLNTFPELSVAFWRWAMWKMFESANAPGRGVVAFITNRKFLTGWPYAGLRKSMRERFDRIEIVDLRGDVRRGERAGVAADGGVFNIQVGTCIAVAIADGSKKNGELATVEYCDSWAEGLYARRAKLDWLDGGAKRGKLPNAVEIERSALEDFRPHAFQNGGWVSLENCFAFCRSGMQTKRDDFVYSPSKKQLSERVQSFLTLDQAQAAEVFHETRDRKAAVAKNFPFEENNIERVAYRPLDRRFLYNHRAFGDFLRPELQEVWGQENVGLYAMPGGTGTGPAVWCHGLLPDYHAFSGRGGYAMPLYDRRPQQNPYNLKTELTESLGGAYGEPVTAEDVFDAILCLLSASSYTLRFAEDLEDVFPHVPFPAQPDVFRDAASFGRKIRAVETFARPPDESYMGSGFVRIETQPRGVIGKVVYTDGALTLCADGSGRVTALPQAVWDFSVSGYPVLQRWLSGREGLAADPALLREFRDICGRVTELIDLFAKADTVLERTLRETLSREALGGERTEQAADVGPE